MTQPFIDEFTRAATQLLQRVGDLVGHVLGAKLAADSGEWGTFA